MIIIYLSIKNRKGSGIYNGGNVPFVYLNDEGQAIFDESKYNEKEHKLSIDLKTCPFLVWKKK